MQTFQNGMHVAWILCAADTVKLRVAWGIQVCLQKWLETNSRARLCWWVVSKDRDLLYVRTIAFYCKGDAIFFLTIQTEEWRRMRNPPAQTGLQAFELERHARAAEVACPVDSRLVKGENLLAWLPWAEKSTARSLGLSTLKMFFFFFLTSKQTPPNFLTIQSRI